MFNIRQSTPANGFDATYARFLLTHLSDVPAVLGRLKASLRPGGTLIVEDIDFSGHFSYPATPALARYVELYSQVVRRNGGDPEIGPKLPGMLLDAGFEDVHTQVFQPAGNSGEVKFVNAITLENTAPAIEEAGLASANELARLIDELYRQAEDPRSVVSAARVVQVWARHSTNGGQEMPR